MQKKETLEGIADIIIDENNILEMRFHKTSIDLDKAVKITEKASELIGNLVHANLVDIRKMAFMSSDARKFFGRQDKNTVKAVAIVMNATFHRPLVNLYLKFSRPSLPTKMFDDETEAVNWLLDKLKT